MEADRLLSLAVAVAAEQNVQDVRRRRHPRSKTYDPRLAAEALWHRAAAL